MLVSVCGVVLEQPSPAAANVNMTTPTATILAFSIVLAFRFDGLPAVSGAGARYCAAARVPGQLLVLDAQHLDEDVDAVEERPGDVLLITADGG